uniref:Uncharacterized protein n=1 Tax=Rhizophora mucronata TaxID=61149 RepID=A0A2P2QT36_RHIMU
MAWHAPAQPQEWSSRNPQCWGCYPGLCARKKYRFSFLKLFGRWNDRRRLKIKGLRWKISTQLIKHKKKKKKSKKKGQ